MSRHSTMYSGMFSCSIDINECETANGGCEQMCSNTIGSFACSCDVGYWLDRNGLNCNGKHNLRSLYKMPNHGIQTTLEICFFHTYRCNCVCNIRDSLQLMSKVFSALLALSTPVVGMLPIVLVPAMIVMMIVALLCGVIFVVCQLRKKEKYIPVSRSFCF